MKCLQCGCEMSADGFGTGMCLMCRAKATADVLYPSATKGNCNRCKVPLVFSTIPTGNCQPNCRYRFGMIGGQPQAVFHGAAGKTEWEADLCDKCVADLTIWLSGDDRQNAEGIPA